MALGPRVGRTAPATEQYAYIYKKRLFSVLQTLSYPDVDDNFNRDPFVGHFSVLGDGRALSQVPWGRLSSSL